MFSELTKYLKQRNLCDTAEWDLLSFVPGRLLAQYKFDKEELHNVLYNLGRTVAFKHEALKVSLLEISGARKSCIY